MKHIFALLLTIATVNIQAQTVSPLLKRDAKVFVVSLDKGAVIHGQDALREWNYWKVVDKQDDADIIVNFKIHRVFSYSFKGYAEVSNAKTHDVLLKTKSYNTTWKLNNHSFNGKKVVVNRLVTDRLIPMIEPEK